MKRIAVQVTILLLISVISLAANTSGSLCQNDSSLIIVQKAKKQAPVFFYYQDLFRASRRYELAENRLDTLSITGLYPVRIISVDENKKYKNGRNLSFVVYPGEKLRLYKNKHGETSILSTDSLRNNELNFFNAFEKECGEFEGFLVGILPLSLSASERQKILADQYVKRTEFLEYYKINHNIREEYYSYLKNMFLNNYLTGISSPFYSPYIQKTLPPDNEIDKILEEKIVFNDSIFHESWYRSAVLNYISMKSAKNTSLTGTNIEKIYKTAVELLNGNTLEILLFDILNMNRMSIDKGLNITIVEKLLEISKNDVIRSHASLYLHPFYKGTGTRDETNERLTLLTDKYKTENLTTVLNKLKGDFTYIDFWASWCTPCIAEIPLSKKLKAEFESKGINFIYISTDENPAAWEKTWKKIGLNPVESYLLPDGNDSELVKKFKISSIPRYILLDRTGKIISEDAPRPSDPKIKKMFEDLMRK